MLPHRLKAARLKAGLSVGIGATRSSLLFLCRGRRSGGNDSWIFRLAGKINPIRRISSSPPRNGAGAV